MTPDTRTQIATLHALYVSLTGLDIRLDMAREYTWFEWIRRGFTQDDLRLVVAHRRRQTRAGITRSLKFSNLVGSVDWFEEDLAEARARARVPRVDPARADTLRSSGRPAAPAPPEARSAGEILSADAALAQFRALKDTL